MSTYLPSDLVDLDVRPYIIKRQNHFPLSLPENELSRRYLGIIQSWIPLAVSFYEHWPVRPDSGHFFGGVHFYGQETLGPVYAITQAVTSPEFDERSVGIARNELIDLAVKGLRYLCFTHDTGPEDCVRPDHGLGRLENAGKKWGEWGRGFFPESQCGRNLSSLVQIVLALREHLDDETINMVGRIALDYMMRFENLDPRTGAYFDTQTEENAWTSLGLVSGALFLEHHPRSHSWLEHANRWLFSVSTTPADAHNKNSLESMIDSPGVATEESIDSLAAPHVVTTLPDLMCENHGFVHPSYTASSIRLGMGMPVAMYRLFGRTEPVHAYWNRKRIYETLKPLTDRFGTLIAPQGMDWPYISSFHAGLTFHGTASLFLNDSEAASMEINLLDLVERMQSSCSGRLIDKEIADRCHGQQDPGIIKEPKGIWGLAQGYFLHRLVGPGAPPVSDANRQRKYLGTQMFPHSGFARHRHNHGQTTIAWRNNFTVLPFPSDGQLVLGPSKDGLFATLEISGVKSNSELISVTPSRTNSWLSVCLTRNIAAAHVQSETLFASLPTGSAIFIERLHALKSCEVTSITHGKIEIVNERFRDLPEICPGRRDITSPAGAEILESFASTTVDDDRRLELGNVPWVNIDGRMGVVLPTETRTMYHNRHFFEPWRAISDYLYGHRWSGSRCFEPSERVSQFATAVVPDQSRGETEQSRLVLGRSDDDAMGCLFDNHLMVANFSVEDRMIDFTFDLGEIEEPAIFLGISIFDGACFRYRLWLSAGSSVVCTPRGWVVGGTSNFRPIRIDCQDDGTAYLSGESGESSELQVRSANGNFAAIRLGETDGVVKMVLSEGDS